MIIITRAGLCCRARDSPSQSISQPEEDDDDDEEELSRPTVAQPGNVRMNYALLCKCLHMEHRRGAIQRSKVKQSCDFISLSRISINICLSGSKQEVTFLLNIRTPAWINAAVVNQSPKLSSQSGKPVGPESR